MNFSPAKTAPLKGLLGKGLIRAPYMLHLGGALLPSYFTELRLSPSTPGTSASTLASGETDSEEIDTKGRPRKGKVSFLDGFIAEGTEDTPLDDPSVARSLDADFDAPEARSSTSESPTWTPAHNFPSPESRVVTSEHPWRRSPPKSPEEVALAEFADFEAKLSRRGASAPSGQEMGMMEFAALERKLSEGGSEKDGDESVGSRSKPSDGISVGLIEPRVS